MRLLRKLMVGLAAFAALPLASAQGPVPQKPAKQEAGPVLPGAAAPTTPVTLDAKDVEAWLDGFMPYALARGQVAGAVVTVVRGDGVVLDKGYGFAAVVSRMPVDSATPLFRPGDRKSAVVGKSVSGRVILGGSRIITKKNE